MITPKLFFGIDLKFDLTLNEVLQNLSALKVWDKGLQKYLYIFPIEKLDEVIALTGKQISFEDEKEEIINIIHHSPSLKEEMVTEKFKGKGFVYIQKFPKMFRVKTVMRKEEQTFDIPIETVIKMWSSIKKFKLNEKIRTSDVAEEQIKRLGINRYHKETGYFQFNKLFGSRHDYFYLIYYPLKVLQHYRVIKYYKEGAIERIADKWELEGGLNGQI